MNCSADRGFFSYWLAQCDKLRKICTRNNEGGELQYKIGMVPPPQPIRVLTRGSKSSHSATEKFKSFGGEKSGGRKSMDVKSGNVKSGSGKSGSGKSRQREEWQQ